MITTIFKTRNRRMKVGILLAATFFSTLSFTQLKINDLAPLTDYQMEATDGTQLTLDNVKGESGTLVIFSCNTCPFVVGYKDGSFPGWERNYNAIMRVAQEKGVGMILVNANEANRTPTQSDDSIEEMHKRSTEQEYAMPYVIDKDSRLADAFGAKTTPHVYLFDKDNKLVYMGSIDNTWDPKRKKDIPYLQNAFDKLSEGKIKVAESQPRGCSIKRIAI